MDNFAALKAATLGAQQIQSPASPLGASSAPELALLHQSGFQLPQSNAATGAQAYNTNVTVANQKQAAQAHVEALKARAKEIADATDPKNYTVKRKEDGGFDFFDPKGQQIDIATYTSKTGQKASDVLKDSENPIDIQYVADKKNLEDLINAIVNKDSAKLDSYKQLAEAEGISDLTKMKPQEVIDQFKKHYERYYVPRTQDPAAWGKTPSPQLAVPNQQVTANQYPYLGGGL